ncbi:MAG: DNA ligase (NAD+), partial [Bacteroidia bacterium]
EEVDGIGSIMAQSLHAWFTEPDHIILIDRLRDYGLNFQSARIEMGDSALAGKIFVLTGSLPNLTRSEASEMIEKVGGRTSSSVSKKTDYVLAGEASGSKYAKAVKLGLQILDESDFHELINAS